MTAYDEDVVAWAQEQAVLLRAGRLSEIDMANIAEEIEDVGKSEKRDLARRMAALLANLFKWKYQPAHRCSSWQRVITEQRKALAIKLKGSPSLKVTLTDPDSIAVIWADAIAITANELGLDCFPDESFWSGDAILSTEFWPS
jgi:hypothetical protein